jgi:predicted dehydrogenase
MSVDIAFIGAGGIASSHLGHFEENERANVVAVCDIDEGAAMEWAEVHDATAYTDWEAMFDDGGFEAVFVCVPPFAHEGQELRAAEEGVHLFVEKPLGLSREYPERVLEAVESADIITQAGHHMRYLESVRQARDLIGDRPVATIYGRWVGGVHGDEDHWWRRRETSGGQVVEQSTHIFDLVRYLGGDVDHVSAEGDLRVQEDHIDFPDAISATLRHEDGLPSHVLSSCASPDFTFDVKVIAEDCSLRIAGASVVGEVDGEPVDITTDDSGHNTEIDAFVDAVAEDDPSRCRSPYADAIRTFDLTLAATEAVDADGPVEVRP